MKVTPKFQHAAPPPIVAVTIELTIEEVKDILLVYPYGKLRASSITVNSIFDKMHELLKENRNGL